MSAITVETLRGEFAYENTVGTHLVGHVECTRHDIEQVFGEPTYVTTDTMYDKVTTEWVLEFSDGLIATIYDWKRYEMGVPAMHEIEDWHIGGKEYGLEERVLGLLGR